MLFRSACEAASVVLALTAVLSVALLGDERVDRDKAGLRGPVHTVRLETEEDGTRRFDGASTYDADGYLALREDVSDFGERMGTTTFRREKGRLVEEIVRGPGGEELQRMRVARGPGPRQESVTVTSREGTYIERHAYDRSGRLLETVYLVGGKTMGRTVLTYASSADPVEIAFFDGRGRRAVASVGPCLGAHRLTYRYTDGRLVERTLYEPDGSVKQMSTYAYESRGEIVEEVRKTASALVRFTLAYEFDERGNWIRRTATIEPRTKELDGEWRQDEPSRKTVHRVITYYRSSVR